MHAGSLGHAEAGVEVQRELPVLAGAGGLGHGLAGPGQAMVRRALLVAVTGHGGPG